MGPAARSDAADCAVRTDRSSWSWFGETRRSSTFKCFRDTPLAVDSMPMSTKVGSLREELEVLPRVAPGKSLYIDSDSAGREEELRAWATAVVHRM